MYRQSRTLFLALVVIILSMFLGNLQAAAQVAPVDCQIVIAPDCSREVKASAQDMSLMLTEMTGKDYPVVTDEVPIADREIVVGRNRHLNAMNLDIDWTRINPDGYTIRKVGNSLVITGGPERGTLNGIYVFLEKYLGCRWFAPDCTVIPKRNELTFPDITVEETPAFRWRGLMVSNIIESFELATPSLWGVRNRGNYFTFTMYWKDFKNHPLMTGIWREAVSSIHTLGHDLLVSTEKYYDKHPEYFALVGGKRIREAPEVQLCLTNPEVVQVVAQNSKEWIARDPGANMMNLSLGDNPNMCQCETCRDSYAKYGVSGTVIRFVNQAGEIIAKEYPDILTSTLAYWTTHNTPTGGVRPSERSIVDAGYLDTCRYHALDECQYNLSREYLKVLKGWIAIAPSRVRLWLYTYGFGPQMHRFQRNYRLFKAIGVSGFYMDDGWTNVDNRLLKPYDLYQYLHAKLMWDPQTDLKQTVREFCQAFYGPAGHELEQYYHTINDEVSYTEDPLAPLAMKSLPGLHCRSESPPLNLKSMRRLDALFERAEAKVPDDEIKLKRIRQARLFLQYQILCHSPQNEPMFARAVRDVPGAAKEAGLSKVPNVHLGGGTLQDIATFVKAMSSPGKGAKKE